VDSLLDLAMVAFERLGVRVSTKNAMSKDADVSSVEVSDVAKVKTTRLTAFERLVFLVGMALPSIVVLGAPSDLSVGRFDILYFVSLNVHNALVASTILVFLQRCTTTFTPLSVFTMMALLILGSYIAQFEYLCPPLSLSRTLTHNIGLAMALMPLVIFIFLCLTCLYHSTDLLQQLLSGLFRINGESGFHGAPNGSSPPGAGDDYRRQGVSYQQPSGKKRSFMFGLSGRNNHNDSGKHSGKENEEMAEDHIQQKIKAIDSFYQNAVPAAHMSSLLLLAVSQTLPYVYHDNYEAVYGTVGFVTLLLVVIIIFIENRVRHNEVERTLLRMVSSVKKSYVRYLSHELRTPLNTTWLGIKLLSDEVNALDEDERDEDQIEILNSMGTACKTACDILDNMIQVQYLKGPGIC